MNISERKQAVLAMERLIRSVNDEELLMPWLACGVPDGDIDDYTEDEVDDSLIEDDQFAVLVGLFLRIMARAEEEGGLYIDKIVSKEWK